MSSFFYILYKTLLRGGKNLKKSYGEWAVVTGATDGIGKAIAFELARKGMSVLLIGRSADKLEACRPCRAHRWYSERIGRLCLQRPQKWSLHMRPRNREGPRMLW